MRGHTDEILDIQFNATGTRLVTASSDQTARIYNVNSASCTSILAKHEGEISKVSFNPSGTKILTGSADRTARVWDAETGEELAVLEGHTDEIFSC